MPRGRRAGFLIKIAIHSICSMHRVPIGNAASTQRRTFFIVRDFQKKSKAASPKLPAAFAQLTIVCPKVSPENGSSRGLAQNAPLLCLAKCASRFTRSCLQQYAFLKNKHFARKFLLSHARVCFLFFVVAVLSQLLSAAISFIPGNRKTSRGKGGDMI